MRVLLVTHATTVGGTQLACRAMAPALAARGHEVTVVGPPGPLDSTFSVPFVPGDWEHTPGRRPSLRVAATLARVARQCRADVVHLFGGVAICHEGVVGPQLAAGIPIVATDYGLPGRTRYPASVPLVIGRPSHLASARAGRSGSVSVVPPPVEIDADRPGGSAGMPDLDLDRSGPVITLVSRLEEHQKGPGLRSAIRALTELEMAATLLVVGEGSARQRFEAVAAEMVDDRVPGRVVFAGEMLDPRPAYEAADVVVGLGTSALRGLAFGKPVVVLGEDGSGETADAGNLMRFHEDGFFATAGTEPLSDQLHRILIDGSYAASLGEIGRRFVEDHRSPAAAAERLERVYLDARSGFGGRRAAVGSLAGLVAAGVRRRAGSALRRRP